jgi:hypothetical protein
MLPLRAVQCPSWAARCDETNARRESHTVIITSCPPLLGTNPTEWQAAASAAVAHWQPGYGSAGLRCRVGGAFTQLHYTAACAQCNARMATGTEQSGAARAFACDSRILRTDLDGTDRTKQLLLHVDLRRSTRVCVRASVHVLPSRDGP